MAKRESELPVVAIVIGLVVLLGAGAAYFLLRPKPETGPVLTGAAKAYVRYLRLSDVDKKATESYLKQAVVEFTGNVTNTGDRVLQLVEVNCVFRDAYGQVVLRERVSVVGRKTGKLAPGQTKPFRLAFDNVPESWNQAVPDLVIAQIVFG